MAHCRENTIVLHGVQCFDLGSDRLPQRAHRRECVGAGLGLRRQHHALALIKVGARCTGPALFGTRNGMAGHEIGKTWPQRGACRLDHIGLGAAGIGHDGAGFQVWHQFLQYGSGLAHRHRQQDAVGLSGLCPVDGTINQTELTRDNESCGAPPDTQHLADRADLLQCQRK